MAVVFCLGRGTAFGILDKDIVAFDVEERVL
jgi:hypothetical protein